LAAVPSLAMSLRTALVVIGPLRSVTNK
jgi:hypothetical protein